MHRNLTDTELYRMYLCRALMSLFTESAPVSHILDPLTIRVDNLGNPLAKAK